MSTAIAPSKRRILAASMVGTAVEFYDFYIYATATALLFGALFFPSGDGTAEQLKAYATFGVAFVARPIGGIVFGHFGDRIGRKSTLVASLLLMGGSTMLIAFLPTYAHIGWVAPLLLCILRFGQGFGLGGEWGGAALLANENAPKGWEARYGTAPQQGAPIGFICANGLFLMIAALLSPAEFATWGWRIPFLASALMVAIGLWIRLKLTETPAFAAERAVHEPLKVPLAAVLSSHWREMVLGTLASIACFMVFYIMTTFSLGYGTKVLHYSVKAYLGAQVAAIPFMALGVHLSGWLGDVHTSPRKVLMLGTLGTIIAGALLPLMLIANALFIVWLYLAFAAFVMGLVYGPLGAWLPSLFPVNMRYTGVSLTFNLAAILGGGVTLIVAQQLAVIGGLNYVGIYLASAGVVSLIALALSSNRTK